MDLKKLRVASPHMRNYTGVLGAVKFVNGESVEWLPRHVRDRMAAAMPFDEIDENGVVMPAGSVHRMIREAASRAENINPTRPRQTEAEKIAELERAKLDAQKIPELETRESLEAIADREGITGVRRVAARWGVKHRSIAVLIEMILEAQEAYLAKRKLSLEKVRAEQQKSLEKIALAAAAAEPANEGPADESGETPDPVSQTITEAAATGDLAVAVSTEEAPE